MDNFKHLILGLGFFGLLANAQEVDVGKVPTNQDSSIYIEKGSARDRNRERDFEIVSGSDEIAGAPFNTKGKARDNWQTACNEWLASTKESNKDNQVISVSCGTPSMSKEEYLYTYKSSGSYKVKTRIRDSKK